MEEKQVVTLDDFFSALSDAIEKKSNLSVSLVINNKRIDGNYQYNNNYELAGFQNLFVYYYENSKDYTPTKTFSIEKSPREKIPTGRIETIRKKVETLIK